ncbi:MAG: hypothetical protein WC590_00985 [Burkholderiaceae bacterium]
MRGTSDRCAAGLFDADTGADADAAAIGRDDAGERTRADVEAPAVISFSLG